MSASLAKKSDTPPHDSVEPLASPDGREAVRQYITDHKREVQQVYRHPAVRPIIEECHLLQGMIMEQSMQRRQHWIDQQGCWIREENACRARLEAEELTGRMAILYKELLQPWCRLGTQQYRELAELLEENDQLMGNMKLAAELLPVERRLSPRNSSSVDPTPPPPRRSLVEVDRNTLSPAAAHRLKKNKEEPTSPSHPSRPEKRPRASTETPERKGTTTTRRRGSVIFSVEDSDEKRTSGTMKKSPAEITKMRRTIHKDDIVTTIK